MTKSAEAIVNAELLVWARNDSGFSIEEVAKKVQATSERVASWESGERRPTISQLRKLAKVYKRPIATFYLPEPPSDSPMIHDFRRLHGVSVMPESPRLRFEKRRVQFRQDVALELFASGEDAPPAFGLSASIVDDPEIVGKQIRGTLGIAYADQASQNRSGNSFQLWRNAVENSGVLVFQMWNVDPTEARGFSLSDTTLPVIAINVKDSMGGRVFTMIHELAHIMLREGGLCNLSEEATTPSIERTNEIFCNAVAGATLVPKEYLLLENEVASNVETVWSDEDVLAIANRYGVSREALLRRLLTCGRTTNVFYRSKREQFLEEDKPAFSPIPVPYHRRIINRLGQQFTRLVLESHLRETITGSDAAEFLEVDLKHLPNIEREVLGTFTTA